MNSIENRPKQNSTKTEAMGTATNESSQAQNLKALHRSNSE